jgi:hypothetical protein
MAPAFDPVVCFCNTVLCLQSRRQVSHEIIVQFVGFESGPRARVYTFTVREPSSEPRNFTLAISNQAFTNHLISYQDGPQICALKLRSELDAGTSHPPKTLLEITNADLEDYRTTHRPRKAVHPFARKPVEDY